MFRDENHWPKILIFLWNDLKFNIQVYEIAQEELINS